MISPTGSNEIRVDAHGDGNYKTPRGDGRTHNGLDLVCVPGQSIVAPISGKIVREAYPYAGDLRWSGCLIVNRDEEVKMFYMRLLRGMVGREVDEGDEIGWAQNIANKYTPDMIPHIHLEYKLRLRVDPYNYLMGVV